jgi:hypothetical protein
MKKRKTMKHSETVPGCTTKEVHDAVMKIIRLTDEFCDEHLNEEYRQLCSDMALEIAELEIPINRGKPASWASGIAHAAGFVNFLHDPSLSPHMTSSEVAKGFGVSQGTMQSKSKIIRDALDLMPLDPDWCLDSLLEDNPLVWMLDVDGFAVDVRTAPREAQEQAYRMGLIPYIPADRQQPQSQADGAKIIQFPAGQNKNSDTQSARKKRDNGWGRKE